MLPRIWDGDVGGTPRDRMLPTAARMSILVSAIKKVIGRRRNRRPLGNGVAKFCMQNPGASKGQPHRGLRGCHAKKNLVRGITEWKGRAGT